MEDPDILKIIAEHPYSGVMGFHTDAPSAIYPFWKVTLRQKRDKGHYGANWEAPFRQYVEEYYKDKTVIDFAMKLITNEKEKNLQLRKDSLAELHQKEEKPIEEKLVQVKPQKSAKRPRFFQQKFSEALSEKIARLELPLANDGKGIISYLQNIKKNGIPPEIQINNILNLLRDKQFDFTCREYCKIIKELNGLGLLKNEDILQIIKLHPEKVGFDIASGYSKNVPSSVYPFWTIVSDREMFKSRGGEWQQSFEAYVKDTTGTTSHDKELREFAFSLSGPR